MDIFEELPMFEMTNIRSVRTGLPYDIWADSVGKDREGLQHDNRRIKLYYSGEVLSIGFDPPFEVKAGDPKKFRKLKEVRKYLEKYHTLFEMHWNHELDDGDLNMALTLIHKEKLSMEDALRRVDEFWK